MLDRKPDIVISELAEQDLGDILYYTERTWGAVQADIYFEKLDAGLKLLQDNPYVGKSREDWFRGCRCRQIEHHLVLYDVTETRIRIARVFHENMDVERHIDAEKAHEQDHER